MRLLEHLIHSHSVPLGPVHDSLQRLGRREKRVIQDLLDAGHLDPAVLLRETAALYRMDIIDLEGSPVDAAALGLVPYDVARRCETFPIHCDEGVLTVAVADPVNVLAVDEIRALTGRRIERLLSCPRKLRDAIEKHYRVDCALKKAVHTLSSELTPSDSLLSPGMEHLAAEHFDSPVAQTVQRILENAVQMGASDVHLEPRETVADLRYRIDGELTTIQALPQRHYAAIVARIKILSHMDIAEQRRPQDGRAQLGFRDHRIDLRVSTLPSLFGEKVVIRLLSQNTLASDCLDALGMTAPQLEVYERAITAKQGMILITGPTGSGKTTTLYSTLGRIRSGKSNITTIEDPIEYRLDGINQSQINPKIGVTFAGMLRTILRQDPDVILVGEIRDRETADIAFRSSLTGHLVFSTLHTNDAIGCVTRLHDLGLEPYLVGSALLCVVAQRLVRRNCPDCRAPQDVDRETMRRLRAYYPDGRLPLFVKGAGCPKCSGTGVRGRCAIFEVLPINAELQAAIAARASEETLRKKASRDGWKSLAESALEKAAEGAVSLDEILPFLPAENEVKTGLLEELTRYVEDHAGETLLVVRNQELIRKIVRHAEPEDYTLIEPKIMPSEIQGEPAFEPEPAEKMQIALPTPLTPGAEDGDRRRHDRVSRDFLLQYRAPDQTSGSWQATVVKNLAVGGCYFRAERLHDVGTPIEMRLQLPSSSMPIRLRAVVRHSRRLADGSGDHFVGAAFEAVNGEHQERLHRAVHFFRHKKVRVGE